MIVRRIPSMLLVVLMSFAARAQPQGAGLGDRVRSTTLPNGLHVIVVSNATVPFVTVNMVFRGGASTQTTPELEGLPHLIEHMLFRRGDDGGGAFDKAASAIDASWNGATGVESVQYYLTFPARHVARGMQLLSNLILKPTFSQAVLDAERPIVRGELERRASEPQSLLRLDANRLLWGLEGSRLRNPGGNIPSLNAATPSRLNALYKQYYVPNNAALIVSGDVVDSTVFILADKVFRGWKPGPDPMATLAPTPLAPIEGIQGKISILADVKDVTFLVRWRGPSTGTDRASTYAADVFAGLVNQLLSGTQRRLVDGGLFDHVSLRYETLNSVGPVELKASTMPDRAAAAAEALRQELNNFGEPGYFNQEDLSLAKKYQRVAARYRLESGTTAAFMVADFWSSAGLGYYMDYADKLDAQSADDVRAFVRTYLAGKPIAVNILISQENWSSIAAAMQLALEKWKLQ